MRVFLLGFVLSAFSVPCFAQTVLKSEPLALAPYQTAYVQDASCGAGKVLKVTGAIRGLHRKKVCVTQAGDQASLGVETSEAAWSGL
jgi:hypothetical protein